MSLLETELFTVRGSTLRMPATHLYMIVFGHEILLCCVEIVVSALNLCPFAVCRRRNLNLNRHGQNLVHKFRTSSSVCSARSYGHSRHESNINSLNKRLWSSRCDFVSCERRSKDAWLAELQTKVWLSHDGVYTYVFWYFHRAARTSITRSQCPSAFQKNLPYLIPDRTISHPLYNL